jgi:tRNA (guanine37-N1)-methyltransferase
MRFIFVSLFPQVLHAHFGSSIMGRAVEAGRLKVHCRSPRDFTYDRHQKVDDTPFSGAPGMLMRAEPIAQALEFEGAVAKRSCVVIPDPAGEPFHQQVAQRLAEADAIYWVCGHYEGIDARLGEHFDAQMYSLGPYVISSGELAAAVMADAVARQLPGVLGNPESLNADSFADLDYGPPNYTRPAVWRGLDVPAVLLSGDHAAVAQWRQAQSEVIRKRLDGQS